MQVIALDARLEEAFWNHVNRDFLDYYFFVFDWKLRRDQTKIFLALEGERIDGLMLVYKDQIVQLRGNREAVRLLLDGLSLEKVELQAPPECEDIVLGKFTPKLKEEMMLMHLNRGEENIQMTTVPVKLGVENAEEVAALMRRADQKWWGEMTAERLQLALSDALWLGIKENQKLVSAGMARPADFGSNVGVAATDTQHRNRGYATSIVSALVQEILKASPIALIHVLTDNAPAVRVYSKVGFKPYKKYLSIRT